MSRRFTALAVALCLIVASIADDVDPCKRQAFRGRCPSVNGAPQMRSQFVLRYYLRNGECVSYPYGHCASDDNEPKLFRYKEECEDVCIKQGGVKSTPPPAKPTDAGFLATSKSAEEVVEAETQGPHVSGEYTYATAAANAEATTDAYETPKTECQRQREARGEGLIRGGFVPECTANGEFKRLQCEQDKSECFCVTVEGIEIDNSRTKAGEEKPDCEKIMSAAPARTNECVGGAEAGPCRSTLARWYYDETTQTCNQFAYSGCGGNGNNYPTEAACQHRCLPDTQAGKCHKGLEPLRNAQGRTVNCAKTECPAGYKCSVVQQNSVCCPDTEKSPVGILHSGSNSAACSQPKERGPCDRYELRFYYNQEINECKYFFYGGCEGNDNNFARVEDCEATCGATHSSKDVPTTEAAIVETAQIHVASTTTTEESSTTTETETEAPTTWEQTTQATTTEEVPSTTEEATEPPTTTTRRVPQTERPRPQPQPQPQSVEHRRPQFQPQPQPQTPPPHFEERTQRPVVELPEDRCIHPKDEGTCGGQFVRWMWNNDKRKCESFAYTGCGGNGNNFATHEECLSLCHQHAVVVKEEPEPELDNVCDSAVAAGDCSGSFMRYAFDRSHGDCRQFTYGGCGGNGNNFATQAECRKKCMPQKGKKPAPPATATTTLEASLQFSQNNICSHPIEIGECSGIFHRFAYDVERDECRQFEYGGCGGNGNNFATLSECRAACLRIQCPPAPQCDFNRCQLVKDSRGCPFCSCPPRDLHPPIEPGFETPSRCPPLDVNLCVEPCIIFSNRQNCKECVCPVLPSQLPPQVLPPRPPPVFQPPPPPTQELSMPPARAPAPPAPQTVETPTRPFVPPQPQPPRTPTQTFEQPAPSAPQWSRTPPQTFEQPAPPAPQWPRVQAPAPPAVAHPPAAVAAAPAPPAPRVISTSNNVVNAVPTATEQNPISRPVATIADLGDKCTQAADPGPCKNFVERWHFNEQRGECEPFQYGGCAGNRNHFFSRHECEVHCARFSRVPRPIVYIDEPSETPATTTRTSTTRARLTTPSPTEAPAAPVTRPNMPRLPSQRPVEQPPTHPARPFAPPSVPVRPSLVPNPPEPSTRPTFVPSPVQSNSTDTAAASAASLELIDGARATTIGRNPAQLPSTFVERVVEVVGSADSGTDQGTGSPSSPSTPITTVTTGSVVVTEGPSVTTPPPPPSASVSITATSTDAPPTTTGTGLLEPRGHKLEIQKIDKGSSVGEGKLLIQRLPAPTVVIPDIATTSVTPTRATRIQMETEAIVSQATAAATHPETAPTAVFVVTEASSTPTPSTASAEPSVAVTEHATVPESPEKTISAETGANGGEDLTSVKTENVEVVPVSQPQPVASETNQAKAFGAVSVQKSSSFTPETSISKEPSAATVVVESTAAPTVSVVTASTTASSVPVQPESTFATSGPIVAASSVAPSVSVIAESAAPVSVTAESTAATSASAVVESAVDSSNSGVAESASSALNVPESPSVTQVSVVVETTAASPAPIVAESSAVPSVPVVTESTFAVPSSTPDAGRQTSIQTAAPVRPDVPVEPPRVPTDLPVPQPAQEPSQVPLVPSSPPQVPGPSESETPTEATSSLHDHETFDTFTGTSETTDQKFTGDEFDAVESEVEPVPRPAATPSFSPRPIKTPVHAPPSLPLPSGNDNDITVFEPPHKPSVDDDTCVQAPDAGSCRDFVPRWFYNAETDQCQEFSYGSCGGNANNFLNQVACETKCLNTNAKPAVPERCQLPKDEGNGVGYFVKWYFNLKNLRCEQMVFRGQDGNENRFSTQTDCQVSCKPVQGIGFMPPRATMKTHIDGTKMPLKPAQRGSNTAQGYETDLKPIAEPAPQPGRPSAASPAVGGPQPPAEGAAPAPHPDAPAPNPYIPPAPPMRPAELTPPPAAPATSAPAPEPAAPASSAAPAPVPMTPAPAAPETAHEESVEQTGGASYTPDASVPSNNVETKPVEEQASTDEHESAAPEPAVPEPAAPEPAVPESVASESNAPEPVAPVAAETENSEAAPEPEAPVAVPQPEAPMVEETHPAPAQSVESVSGNGYGAVPAEEKMTPPPGGFLPTVAPSMKANVDYANNKRLDHSASGHPARVAGISTFIDKDSTAGADFGLKSGETFKVPEDATETSVTGSVETEETTRVPVCPNGLPAMQYADGRSVMCLPGVENQCPSNSVCYFNGMDFYCCPNAEDPYDQHVFGGYDGEEVKHGYKSNLNIHTIRRRQALPPTAFSIDHITKPLRFDDKPITHISRAGSISSLANLRVNPCTQDVDKGQCNEAHLRYFYDINVDTCRLFYFTGCGGNKNNFMTQKECEQRCKLGIVVTTSKPTVPPGRCPGGQLPLGDNAPVLCGNQTDSIGCPTGYYCRTGPPDVCCPGTPEEPTPLDVEALLASRAREIRRKPFIGAAGAVGHHHHHDHDHAHAHEHEHEHHHHVAGVATEQGGAYENAGVDAGAAGADALVTNAPAEAVAAPAPAASGEEHGASAAATAEAAPASVSAAQPSEPTAAGAVPANSAIPENMCPDGSDALLDDSGKAKSCGAGFDGHDLCPKGFYCSIDPERDSRLCCPMSVQGSNIPPPPVIAPYFGHRLANPGEVVERGSLPNDPKPPRLSTPKPRMMSMEDLMETSAPETEVGTSGESHAEFANAPAAGVAGGQEEGANAVPAAGSAPAYSEDTAAASAPQLTEVAVEEKPTPLDAAGPAEVHPANMPAGDHEHPYAHLMLKPAGQPNKLQQMIADSMKNHVEEAGVHIHTGSNEDPFELENRLRPAGKSGYDKSVCQLRPTEGRVCREDEPQPTTNLQYFYSVRDRKCKLFFHRGCGGNLNRFPSQAACERLCMA